MDSCRLSMSRNDSWDDELDCQEGLTTFGLISCYICRLCINDDRGDVLDCGGDTKIWCHVFV